MSKVTIPIAISNIIKTILLFGLVVIMVLASFELFKVNSGFMLIFIFIFWAIALMGLAVAIVSLVLTIIDIKKAKKAITVLLYKDLVTFRGIKLLVSIPIEVAAIVAVILFTYTKYIQISIIAIAIILLTDIVLYIMDLIYFNSVKKGI